MTMRNAMRLALCAAVVTIALPAGAQSFAQIHGDSATKPVAMTGGLVFSGVGLSPDFKVTHPATGQYVLKFKKNLFTGIPAFTCSSINTLTSPTICAIWSVDWPKQNAVTTVKFRTYFSISGKPVDSDLEFLEFTTAVGH
jgi:hypothetical protein